MQIKDLIPWGRKTGEFDKHDEDEHPILSLQRDMNRVFDQFWHRFDRSFAGTEHGFGLDMPRTDIVDTESAIEVSVELPGIDEEDLDVSLTDDALTIKGEKKTEREESKHGYMLSERSYGSFYRTIPLPPGVATEDVDAVFEKGVLTLTLPKSPEAQAKVKKIDVKTA